MDKTGTLTEGGIGFAGLWPGTGASSSQVETALASLASSRAANATMLAIRGAITSTTEWQPINEVPFTSARKWSGATFAGHGTWVLGAPEVVEAADPDGAAFGPATWPSKGPGPSWWLAASPGSTARHSRPI